MGGGQIDRDAADRKGEAAVFDGGAHPLPGLADGGVGQTYHIEGGQTAGQVALHRHRVSGHTVQAERTNGIYHGTRHLPLCTAGAEQISFLYCICFFNGLQGEEIVEFK